LADLAHQQRIAGDAGNAALLTIEALPDYSAGISRPYVAEAELELDEAFRALRELIVLPGLLRHLDGKRIVTAFEDGTGRMWDAESGKPIGEALKRVPMAVSPDGKRIVTASEGRTMRLWDTETDKPIGEPIPHANSVAFSLDSKRFVTPTGIGSDARLWD